MIPEAIQVVDALVEESVLFEENTSALRSLLSVGKRACHPERQGRWSSMREFHDVWLRAIALLDNEGT